MIEISLQEVQANLFPQGIQANPVYQGLLSFLEDPMDQEGLLFPFLLVFQPLRAHQEGLEVHFHQVRQSL